jgi:RNA polymerase sigma-70 factor (ECF subfamily)
VPPNRAYGTAPEPLVVRLAGSGDERAFEELVRRRQSWVRNLMRRLSRDASLADDLAQQAFLRIWRTLPQLQHPERFPGWLKRVAVNVWLQHQRKSDPLAASDPLDAVDEPVDDTAATTIDIDDALARLPTSVRLCVVLSYHAEMSHDEIAEATSLPLGTVKSHIRRGTAKLESLLSAYAALATSKVAS